MCLLLVQHSRSIKQMQPQQKMLEALKTDLISLSYSVTPAGNFSGLSWNQPPKHCSSGWFLITWRAPILPRGCQPRVQTCPNISIAHHIAPWWGWLAQGLPHLQSRVNTVMMGGSAANKYKVTLQKGSGKTLLPPYLVCWVRNPTFC